MFSHLFLYKKHEKPISECEKRWIYKHKGFDDKLFKELFFQPGTNVTEKFARWKHVSTIILLCFFFIAIFISLFFIMFLWNIGKIL